MLRWKKVDRSKSCPMPAMCYHGYRRGEINPAAVVEKPIWAENRNLPLWTVEIIGRGRIVSGGYDCFPLREAKSIANREVTPLTE